MELTEDTKKEKVSAGVLCVTSYILYLARGLKLLGLLSSPTDWFLLCYIFSLADITDSNGIPNEDVQSQYTWNTKSNENIQNSNNTEFIRKANRKGSNVSFNEDLSTLFEFRKNRPIADGSREQETWFEKYTSCRWIVTYLTFTFLGIQVTAGQCMSLALVCMVQNVTSGTNISYVNLSDHIVLDAVENYYVDWDVELQGLVLSATFYLFPLTPVLGGYLSGRFGGKYMVLVLTGIQWTTNLLIPVCAHISGYIVVALRAIGGLASGGIPSCLIEVSSRWTPLPEKAQMFAFIYSAQNIASILTNTLSGFLCGIPVQGGWPFIFYIFGGFSLLCFIPWGACVYDYPMLHPRIDIKEINHIDRGRRSSTSSQMPSPPWTSIFTSLPFWSILIAHSTLVFVFTVLGTYLPIYMNDILEFSIAQNGVLSSLPFVGRFLGAVISGYVADTLLARGYLSVTTVRKLFQVFGCVVSAPCLIVVSFLDKDSRIIAVVLIVLYWTIQSTTSSAFRVNPLDIAPRFVGILMGLTTTAAAISQLIAPVVTSALTKNGTREEWQVVFFICVGLTVGGAIIYAIFASGEEQDWAKDNDITIEVDPWSNDLKLSSHANEGFENDKPNFEKLFDITIVVDESSFNDVTQLGVDNEGFENYSNTEKEPDSFANVDDQDVNNKNNLQSIEYTSSENSTESKEHRCLDEHFVEITKL